MGVNIAGMEVPRLAFACSLGQAVFAQDTLLEFC
jgi:hypothetical protein